MAFNILYIIIPIIAGAIGYVYFIDGAIFERKKDFDDIIFV
jgi:hypothetical protein